MKQIDNKQLPCKEVQYAAHTHAQPLQCFSKQAPEKAISMPNKRERGSQMAIGRGLPIASMEAGGSLDESNESKSGMEWHVVQLDLDEAWRKTYTYGPRTRGCRLPLRCFREVAAW